MNQTIGPDSCFPNLTAAQVKELQKIKSKALFPVYRLYFAWIPLPLIVVALLLTILFAFVSYEAIKCRRVSRKCYIFIINRAIGDILSCVFFLLCAIHLLTTDQENFNIHIFIALVILCGGCLWTAMVSYVSLSLIKLYAVYKPLNYRSTFSTKRCMLLIAIG
ncbi:unnamed protein product [Anisakis simplex]|uniref:L-3,4-dihydroxyphenylalanine receptor (inferred by orthology to a C. elegans protein) n=1 Tax=Anisakis simplex TaxID=6269 RepID=A0A0M3K927_ANISI|nr:unnamed protein product [Anisakis simplex]